jgi:RNA polymerase sigma factor (sigma-70 family)
VTDLDEKDLVRMAQNGDAQAFGELYSRHYRLVFSYVRGILRQHPLEVEDVTSDAFRKAFIAIRTFRGGSKIGTWFVRIAINECLNYLEKAKQHRHESIDEDNPEHYRSKTENPEGGRTKIGGSVSHHSAIYVEENESDQEAQDESHRKIVLDVLDNKLDAQEKRAMIYSIVEDMKAKQIAPLVGFAHPGKVYDVRKKYAKLCLRAEREILKSRKVMQPAERSP